MMWRVQKRECFLHAIALYYSRMKKTPPDLECLSISTPHDPTPERHKIAAPGTRLRLAAFAVHAQRARIRISLRSVVTV